MDKWKRLTADALHRIDWVKTGSFERIIIARRADGKCCVGHVKSFDDRNVTVANGNYETTLWFNEPRMFILVDPPSQPEVKVGDPSLKFD